MGKVLYSVSMSLDGFIAGPGGDMSWLTGYLGPNPTVDELIGKIGALLVGNRTFRGDDPHRGTDEEGKPFGGGWTDRSSCLPTTPQPAPGGRVSPSSTTSPVTPGRGRRRCPARTAPSSPRTTRGI